MAELDGVWEVRREGGALPPLAGVRKRIRGRRGETIVGPLRLPFRVDGLTLRYEAPLAPLVDELEPAADGFRGRATIAGREYGTFTLRRIEMADEQDERAGEEELVVLKRSAEC